VYRLNASFQEQHMVRVKLFITLILLGTVTLAADERVLEGPWNNRRTGSSGSITCTASEVAPGQWKAVFRGSFQGQPFEYSVDFLAKTNRVGSELEGSATINGQQYQWRGTRKASQLRGQYQASNGWNGEIVLNETKTGGRNVPMSVEPESIEEVGIKPIVRDGDHLLFVGNELMENDGGVYNYLQTALRKRGMEVTHPSKIGTGKSLREMLTPESPAGLNFDYPPHLVGQQLQDDPELRMTRELREIPQYRAWDVAQA
jgi:hypothetical protein